MTNFQAKHIETTSFDRVKAMTTVIAIKCKDGIVIASDSQGTSGEEKTTVTKVFQIKDYSIGGGASGYDDSIRDFVRLIKIDNGWDSETKLRKEILEALYAFNNSFTFNIQDELNSITLKSFDIRLHILMGVKLKEREYLLYRIGLKDLEKPQICLIENDFESVGSGGRLANLLLTQQSRIHSFSELDIDTTIEIALYIIDEVKNMDLLSGGNTQVVIIDNNGFKKIKVDQYPKFYNDMIDNLSDNLVKKISDSNKTRDTLKKIFPVSKTEFL